MRLFTIIYLLFFLATSCNNFPKDPDNTLQKINHGTLIVGYSDNPPWVVKNGDEPIGLEPDLVRGFAKTQNARIKWVKDTEQDLFEQLEKNKLHLVIGGINDKSPWKSKITFTRPYLKNKKDKHVWAVLKGENAFMVAIETFLHQQQSNPDSPLQQYESDK